MYKKTPTLQIFCILATLSNLVQTDQLEDKLRQFSQDLFQNVVKEHEKNVIISPLIIESAIAMLYMGASGKTATAIGKTFANENKYQVADYYSFVLQGFDFLKEIAVANKLYINKNFKVKEKYKNYLRERFHSSIEAVDLSNAEGAANSINEWVKTKTKNLIPQLIEPWTFNDDTNLFLVNAITFNGKWASKFCRVDTEIEKFYLDANTSVEVPMMFQIGKFVTEYHENLNATSLILPYSEGGLSFVIFLPNSHDDFYDLENKIKNIKLSDLKRGPDFKYEIEVGLPKFKVEFEIDLRTTLIDMGLITLFPDFGDISASEDIPLYVPKFIHKAVISVDEKGSPAEAVSVFELADRKVFKANRPFIYFIIDELDFPLFSGSYKGVQNKTLFDIS